MFHKLNKKKILINGGLGMIGSTIAKILVIIAAFGYMISKGKSKAKMLF